MNNLLTVQVNSVNGLIETDRNARLQPGTVSFNAIATGHGRFSEWQRSLEVAGQQRIQIYTNMNKYDII